MHYREKSACVGHHHKSCHKAHRKNEEAKSFDMEYYVDYYDKFEEISRFSQMTNESKEVEEYLDKINK